MKFPLLLISVILFTSMVSAVYPIVDINVTDGTIRADGFIYYDAGMFYGKVPGNYLTSVNDSMPFTNDCSNTTSVINSTNYIIQTCTKDYNYQKSLILNFSNPSSVVLGTQEIQDKYNNCVDEKSSYVAALAICQNDKTAQGIYKENFTQCSTDLQICNGNLNTANTAKQSIQTDLDSSKNQKWIFAAIALALGYAVRMFQKGEIGGTKKREITDSYNPRQAG